MSGKEKIKYQKPKKKFWHLYSLQTLQPDKLAKIVNKVSKHEYMLIK